MFSPHPEVIIEQVGVDGGLQVAEPPPDSEFLSLLRISEFFRFI